LKAANIKVRSDGTVKVRDFGLAKALVPDVSTSSLSMSPTRAVRAHGLGGNARRLVRCTPAPRRQVY